MSDVAVALALHVVAIVLWIGGVAMVTTVLLPSVRRFKDPVERIEFFELLERRFAWQARASTLLAGASGLYIVIRMDLWANFRTVDGWWLDAMVLVWLVFTVMLFIAEPLFLDRWFRERGHVAPERIFLVVQRLHWVLLVLSLVTVFGAAAGSHGAVISELWWQ